ncbi:MAG: BMP family ABC transporter substrate-binding protein, partial [Streptosporangiaceae bacterium]
MRQTVPAVAALTLLALLAVACGSSNTTGSASSPSAAAAGPKFKACVVSDTGTINDKSFNQSAYEGATQAATASGGKITAQFLPSSSPSDYAPNITTFINQKCGIIVTVGFLMGDATAAAAKANPNQKFAIVDFTYAKPFKNVSALAYNTVEDGFQAGYLAAGMSKTKKVAT